MDFIVQFANTLAKILYFAILARSVLSWVSLSPSNPLVLIVHQITEPFLGPLRRVLPKFGGLDLSPIAAIIIIIVIQRILGGLAT